MEGYAHIKETESFGGSLYYQDPEINSQMQSSCHFSFMDRHCKWGTCAMDTPTSVTNSSSLQISHFILMGLPGIHGWQHWLSLPLALLYFLALGANLLIMITIQHEAMLHVPMYHFLGILAVVDMGLATTIMPKMLATFWFDAKAISLPECFAQIYAIHCFFFMESGIFLCMALGRYIAICHPLRYLSIVTDTFVVKATGFMVLRNGLFTIPVPILSAQRHYCSKNEINHCLCSDLGVTSLACNDITVNKFYQLISAWILIGSDMALVFSSYVLILHSVLRLNSPEAVSKLWGPVAPTSFSSSSSIQVSLCCLSHTLQRKIRP